MPLLAAILIALAISLWTAAWPDMSAKDWLLTGLPAWLQGLGTVAAAYIAWYAFGTWQRQEVARRRAEWAEKLLLLTSEAMLALDDVRIRKPIPSDLSLREFAQSVMVEKAFEKLAQMRVVTEKIEVLGATVGDILSVDVLEAVVDILKLANALRGAYNNAYLLRGDDGELAEALAVIGCRRDADDTDRFGQDCVDVRRRLSAALEQYLRFDLGA